MKIFNFPIFNTLISVSNLNNKKLNDKLLKYCKKISKTKGKKVSNEGGFQSDFIDNSLIKDFFEETKKYIINYINCYNIGESYNPIFLGAWFNINNKGNFNKVHHHFTAENVSYFSAVYYLKVFKNCGNITFINPDFYHKLNPFFLKKFKSFNTFNSSEYWIEPKEMDLIIFPSSLSHYVKPNLSNQERISLAFNIKI